MPGKLTHGFKRQDINCFEAKKEGFYDELSMHLLFYGRSSVPCRNISDCKTDSDHSDSARAPGTRSADYRNAG